MAKQHLLLVDGDAKSLRVMEVSLKKAGFQVTTAIHGKDAFDKVQISPPDLVLSETRMPEMDGFELCKILKSDDRFRQIPFVFLTNQKAVESKVKGLETGAEDYLTKPIYIKEVVTRARMILQKVEKERTERKETRNGFTGSLSDMGVVDLVQTFEIGRKTGLIKLDGERSGVVFFKEGRVVDAELGRLRGENAFYRMLNTFEGAFEVSFTPVDRPERIEVSTQGLLMEGMRRLDEWGRMLEQLPPLETVFELDYSQLAERLAEIPDEVNGLLRLFDGRRTLSKVVDDSDFEDLAALGIISKLYFEGLIREGGGDATGERARRPGIEEWLSSGSRPPEPNPLAAPPAVAPPVPPHASAATRPPPEVPEVPVAAIEEALEVPTEAFRPLDAAPPAQPPPPAFDTPVPSPPPTPTTSKADVIKFEPKPRVPGSTPSNPGVAEPVAQPRVSPAPVGSSFLVASPPRELERARQTLLSAWSQVEDVGLEGPSTWAPVSSWSRIEARPSLPPEAQPEPPQSPAPLTSAPSRPPLFGGAASEPVVLPVVAPAHSTVDLVPAVVEEEELQEEPTPYTELPLAAANPATPPLGERSLGDPVMVPLPAPGEPPPVVVVSPASPGVAPAAAVPLPPPAVPLGKVSAPADEEAKFFDDTEGQNSQPLTGEAPVPASRGSRTLLFVIAAGLLVGIATTVMVISPEDASLPTQPDDAGLSAIGVPPPVTEPAYEFDAGPAEVEPQDAGEPIDAGPPLLAAVPHDAGLEPRDAGPELPDAGHQVHDAGLDAGAVPAVVAAVDAGPKAIVSAEVDAGSPVAAVRRPGANAESILNEAKAALVQQRYRAAVGLYRKLKAVRDDVEVRTGLGVALVMSDVTSNEAIGYLKEGVQADPQNAAAWLALGIGLQNVGRDAEAKAPYREFLKLKPTGPQAQEVREVLRTIP